MNDQGTPTAIADTKNFRRDLDVVLQNLKLATNVGHPSQGTPKGATRNSRERSIAITKIQEAIMWLGMDLKAINEDEPGACPNPYPQSYNPESPIIDPTADNLKL